MGNGLRVENRTSDSRPWRFGRRYSCSFELYPKAKSEEHIVFSGTASTYSLTFMTWLEPVKVVVKAKRAFSPRAYTDWTTDYLERYKTSVTFLRPFNKLLEVSGRSERISITKPTLARMNNVSDLMPFTRFFQRFGKILRKREVVLFEAKLRGRFRYFTYEDGSPGCDYVDDDDDVIDAFGHFAFHYSNGIMVLCNLKGVVNIYGDRYRLVTPIIHSNDSRCGSRDDGKHGVSDFFKYHQCNDICKSFLQFKAVLDDL